MNAISWSARASLFIFQKHTHKKRAHTGSVMYITDKASRSAHNQNWWEGDFSPLQGLDVSHIGS